MIKHSFYLLLAILLASCSVTEDEQAYGSSDINLRTSVNNTQDFFDLIENTENKFTSLLSPNQLTYIGENLSFDENNVLHSVDFGEANNILTEEQQDSFIDFAIGTVTPNGNQDQCLVHIDIQKQYKYVVKKGCIYTGHPRDACFTVWFECDRTQP